MSQDSNEKINIAKTATEAIQMLWQGGFLTELRSLSDCEEQLNDDGYNFPKSHLSKALDRADFVVKKGKQGRYRYIQKYPFNPNGNE